MSVPVLLEEDHEDVKIFFKTVVLPKEIDDVKQKMVEHAAYRKELILHDFEQFKEIWDCYFVCPILVRFFELINLFNNLFITEIFLYFY